MIPSAVLRALCNGEQSYRSSWAQDRGFFCCFAEVMIEVSGSVFQGGSDRGLDWDPGLFYAGT